jgi:hypothetical protein
MITPVFVWLSALSAAVVLIIVTAASTARKIRWLKARHYEIQDRVSLLEQNKQ